MQDFILDSTAADSDFCFDGVDILSDLLGLPSSANNNNHQNKNQSDSSSVSEQPCSLVGALSYVVTSSDSSSQNDSEETTSSTFELPPQRQQPPKKAQPQHQRATNKDGHPRRGLSSYNLYFQLERERLVARLPPRKYTFQDVERMAIESHKKSQIKRRHRKSHGKIGFTELARTIANSWKKLRARDKVVFEDYAAIEKARYREQLQEWTASQAAEAAAAVSSSSENVSVEEDETDSQQDAAVTQQAVVSNENNDNDNMSLSSSIFESKVPSYRPVSTSSCSSLPISTSSCASALPISTPSYAGSIQGSAAAAAAAAAPINMDCAAMKPEYVTSQIVDTTTTGVSDEDLTSWAAGHFQEVYMQDTIVSATAPIAHQQQQEHDKSKNNQQKQQQELTKNNNNLSDYQYLYDTSNLFVDIDWNENPFEPRPIRTTTTTTNTTTTFQSNNNNSRL